MSRQQNSVNRKIRRALRRTVPGTPVNGAAAKPAPMGNYYASVSDGHVRLACSTRPAAGVAQANRDATVQREAERPAARPKATADQAIREGARDTMMRRPEAALVSGQRGLLTLAVMMAMATASAPQRS